MATEWIETEDSSNIKQFKYDEDLKILMIEFNNGRLYYYYNVPQNIFDDFVKAGSKGKYFRNNILGNNFHYVEIKNPQ